MYTPFTLLSTFPTFCLPTLFSLFSTPSPQYHPIPSHLQLSPLPPFYFRPLSHPSLLHPLFSSPLTSPLHSFTSPRLASPPPFLLLFYSLHPLYTSSPLPSPLHITSLLIFTLSSLLPPSISSAPSLLSILLSPISNPSYLHSPSLPFPSSPLSSSLHISLL